MYTNVFLKRIDEATMKKSLIQKVARGARVAKVKVAMRKEPSRLIEDERTNKTALLFLH